MAKIQNPLLFSKHFGVDEKALANAGLIDPFLNVDTQLFIDPVLLEKSANQRISVDAYRTFCDHFSNYIRLLAISKAEGDAAWKGAGRLLDLREPAQTGLGQSRRLLGPGLCARLCRHSLAVAASGGQRSCGSQAASHR